MSSVVNPDYRMPAESAPQERIWMAFPCEGYSLGDTDEARHEARSTWSAVAHAVAEFEPVTVVVHPRERAIADRYLSAGVDIIEAPLNDAWMRDVGPTFVVNDRGGLRGVALAHKPQVARELPNLGLANVQHAVDAARLKRATLEPRRRLVPIKHGNPPVVAG
jgi:agmatine/peptidylarginine deiminase